MRRSLSLIDVYSNKLGDFFKFKSFLNLKILETFFDTYIHKYIQKEKYQMRSNLVPENDNSY